MGRALGACCFVFLERTLIETGSSIIQKLFTVKAKFAFGAMMVMTIDSYHGPGRFTFSDYSGMIVGHARVRFIGSSQ